MILATGLVVLGFSLFFAGCGGKETGTAKKPSSAEESIAAGTTAEDILPAQESTAESPAAISAEDRFWDNYKKANLNILPDNQGTIPAEQGGMSLSEGMGHGTFFAQEREDWRTFDDLVQGMSNFRKANGLLRWNINPDGSYPLEDENLNSATETEQNVANAFLLAYEKTGKEGYLNLGLEFTNNLWRNATILFQGKRIFLIADLTENKWWPFVFNDWVYQDGASIPCQPSEDGLICTDIKSMVWSSTYLSPDHVARFLKYDKKHDWQQLYNDWYELMDMVLDAAMADPEGFGTSGYGETGTSPMPDYFKLFPVGLNRLEVRPYSPEYRAFEDEWPMDLLRIPLYVSMDKSNSAYNFLTRFFSAPGMDFKTPEDAAAALPKTNYDQGTIAIAESISDFDTKLTRSYVQNPRLQ